MKCPLITAGFWADQKASGEDALNCLKEECAWWEVKIGSCSVLRTWRALQDIHEVLHDIAKELTLIRPK